MLQPDYPNNHNQPNNLNNRDLRKKRANKTKPPKNFIMPTQQPAYQATNQTISLPLDYPCQVYPRVSTPEQMENVSAEMQKDKSYALSCGWQDHTIIVDVRDLGVSGQLRMEDRKAFNAMLRRIANGQIKAVVVFNVDRLFRNRWGDESGKFMEICHTYGVLVVTPDFIYDFRISWHIDRFKRRCEEAWNYLEYHIYGRMVAAKYERARKGFWIGGGIPFGYVVDLKEKLDNGEPNPKYYRFIPYEPHAKVIRWLFKRYKELNGNLNALMREIEDKPCLFRDFEAGIDPIIVNQFSRMKVDGGYTVRTIVGLRSLLTNRAYIGYWFFKGELISTKNHDDIIDEITFVYAYNRLSQTQFDGTENERLKTRRERYAKQHYSDRPAILKEVVKSDDPEVRIYVKNGQNRGKIHRYYSFTYATEGKEWTHTHGTIESIDLDNIVLDMLREHLRSSEAEQDFQNFTMIEPKVIEEASEELELIKQDIETRKANMARIKAQVESGQLTDSDLLQAANTSYETAKEELKQLEGRKRMLEQMAIAGETSETLRDIERDIKATQANMTRIKAQVESGQLTDPDLAQAANASYAAAKTELKRLEERKAATEQIALEDDERRTYKALMSEVDEAWNEVVLPEEHPRLVYLFIESVTLTRVSPSFCTMRIEWKDPVWETDEALFHKGSTACAKWEEDEIALLEKHYPTASWVELEKLLPARSRLALHQYYTDRNMDDPRVRPGRQRVDGTGATVPYTITPADWEIMQQYNITEKEFKQFSGAKLITRSIRICARKHVMMPMNA